MENTLKYLLVEDDVFDQLSVLVEAEKFPFLRKIGECGNPLAAMELIDECHPDVLFLDVVMPGMSGLDLLRHLRGIRLSDQAADGGDHGDGGLDTEPADRRASDRKRGSGFGLQLAADLARRIGAQFFFRSDDGLVTAVIVWGNAEVAVA